MGRERYRAAGGRGARRLAAALLLAVAGGALVMVDATLNGMPLVPDPAGYALVAVAGVLLTAGPVTDVAGGRFQHVGAAMAVLAVLAMVDWVAIGAEWRPPPDALAGRWALLDAAFLAAAVALTVWLLVHVSRWCASQGLLRAHRRVRRSIHLVGWPWGAWAAITVVSTAVSGQGWAVQAEDTPLVIPVVIAAFAVLAYAAWAVLATRQQILRRVTADEPHPRERAHAAAAHGSRVHPPR